MYAIDRAAPELQQIESKSLEELRQSLPGP